MGDNATSPSHNLVQVCTATGGRKVKCENFSGNASAWYALPLFLFASSLPMRQGPGADDDENDVALQEDLLTVLKVRPMFIYHVQPFR